jgi:hypothetical protein
MRRWRSVLVCLAVIVAAAGVLHTPWGRPLLRRLGGCPVPAATPAQVEAAQARAFRSLRGVSPAPARPALGFTLERTTPEEVRRWAAQAGARCQERRGGALLICTGGAYDEVAFGFRLRDRRLVNLSTLRTGLASGDAAARMRELGAGLQRALGAPAASAVGPPAVLSWRYSDYLAEVIEMPIEGRGHALREHYLSALE